MPNRKEITEKLSKLLEKHINPHNDTRIYSAKEVTFDYATGNSVRVDYMVFKPLNNSVSGIEKGDFYCYEIKSCKKDFKSGHGLNFIGDYNYLVLPQGLYEEIKTLIPYNVGVYEPNEDNWAPLKCIKKAQRNTRIKSVSECLLMMFRSSNRELLKNRKEIC
ncbi:MAG: hypothetical protein ACI37Z_04990 [Candidatus Gastranaerophilaceae bacterium]